jgi:ABC-type spermidine/putrescine transport system permease subunit II
MHTDLKSIQKTLLTLLAPAIAILCVALYILGYPKEAYSILLGSLFSYFSLENLMKSQSQILNTKNKGAFFLPMLTRFVIYACPLILSLQLKSYLNFWTVLISLGVFQIGFIIYELQASIKRIKTPPT